MGVSVRRICPACAIRYGQLVNPDCLICGGAGLVTLGPAALSIHTPEVVAMAVTLALEAVARDIEATTTLSDNRTVRLKRTMTLLMQAGIITGSRPTRALHAKAATSDGIAEEVTGVPPIALDITLSTAPKYRYNEYDRPNARGLPVLSADGHPSHLARLTDPAAAGGETFKVVQARLRDELQAKILLRAAPDAVAIKQRRRNGK